MKKEYTHEDMLKVIQEVEASFSEALAKAEAEVKEQEQVEKTEETQSTEPSEKTEQEEIEDLYSSMEKGEAEVHFKAISKILGVESIAKSEESEESKLVKSELESVKSENDKLKNSNEELKKNLETIVAYVKSKQTAPARKAIVSDVQIIEKSEGEKQNEVKDLSKDQIDSILKEKIRSGKLEKKDRDAVFKFYEKKCNVETIKHLL